MPLAPEELRARIQPLLEAAGLWDARLSGDEHAWFFSVLELLKPRAKRLDDFVSLGQYFFSDDVVYDEAAVEKHLKAERMADHLHAVDGSLRCARGVRSRVARSGDSRLSPTRARSRPGR